MPTGCSTGWRCRAGTGTRPSPRWTGWSCSTCPTTTASGSSTGWRSTGWSALVDVLVWVLDPEKYADAAVHDRYLVPLASHAGVLLVVLNQVDRLDGRRRAACLADLRGAARPRGARRHAAAGRLGAHRCGRRRAARRAGPPGGGPAGGHRPAHRGRPRRRRRAGGVLPGRRRAGRDGRDRAELAADLGDALAAAAGVPTVTAAVERSAVRDGTARTGWPLVRWTRKLRPDPLARLHLGDERARTSLPPAGPVELAAVATAVRRARDAAGEDLPQAWRDDLRRTVEDAEERLPDRLDRAVAGTDLGPDRVPLWQRAVGGLQWVLALVGPRRRALAAGARRPRASSSSTTSSRCRGCRACRCRRCCWSPGCWPGCCSPWSRARWSRLRARRRARAAERRLRAAVDAVAEDELLGPMAAVREDADRFRAAVAAAGR